MKFVTTRPLTGWTDTEILSESHSTHLSCTESVDDHLITNPTVSQQKLLSAARLQAIRVSHLTSHHNLQPKPSHGNSRNSSTSSGRIITSYACACRETERSNSILSKSNIRQSINEPNKSNLQMQRFILKFNSYYCWEMCRADIWQISSMTIWMYVLSVLEIWEMRHDGLVIS